MYDNNFYITQQLDNDLIFKTNNVEKMRIINNGKIGIGTNNPNTLLTLSRSSEAAKSQLELRTNGTISSTNYDGIIFTQFNNSSLQTLAEIKTLFGNDNRADIAFFTRNTDTNTSEKIRITKDGNFGIGRTSPSKKLEVNGDIDSVVNTNAVSIVANNGTGYEASIWANSNYNSTSPGANWGQVMVFENSNIGIGVTSPLQKLDINGKAYFRNNIGINKSNPVVSLEIIATDSIGMPSGSTAQRPSVPISGYFRFNSQTGFFEGYNGSDWTFISPGGSLADTDGDTKILAEASSDSSVETSSSMAISALSSGFFSSVATVSSAA